MKTTTTTTREYDGAGQLIREVTVTSDEENGTEEAASYRRLKLADFLINTERADIAALVARLRVALTDLERRVS